MHCISLNHCGNSYAWYPRGDKWLVLLTWNDPQFPCAVGGSTTRLAESQHCKSYWLEHLKSHSIMTVRWFLTYIYTSTYVFYFYRHSLWRVYQGTPSPSDPIGRCHGLPWLAHVSRFFAKRNPMTCRSLGTLGKSIKITFPIDCNIQMKCITLQNNFKIMLLSTEISFTITEKASKVTITACNHSNCYCNICHNDPNFSNFVTDYSYWKSLNCIPANWKKHMIFQ